MARRDRRSRSQESCNFCNSPKLKPYLLESATMPVECRGRRPHFFVTLKQSNPILKKITWTRVVRGLEKYCPDRTRVGIWIKRRHVISKNRNCLLEGGKFVISRNSFPTSKCCLQLTRIDLFSLVTDFVPTLSIFCSGAILRFPLTQISAEWIPLRIPLLGED